MTKKVQTLMGDVKFAENWCFLSKSSFSFYKTLEKNGMSMEYILFVDKCHNNLMDKLISVTILTSFILTLGTFCYEFCLGLVCVKMKIDRIFEWLFLFDAHTTQIQVRGFYASFMAMCLFCQISDLSVYIILKVETKNIFSA